MIIPNVVKDFGASDDIKVMIYDANAALARQAWIIDPHTVDGAHLITMAALPVSDVDVECSEERPYGSRNNAARKALRSYNAAVELLVSWGSSRRWLARWEHITLPVTEESARLIISECEDSVLDGVADAAMFAAYALWRDEKAAYAAECSLQGRSATGIFVVLLS